MTRSAQRSRRDEIGTISTRMRDDSVDTVTAGGPPAPLGAQREPADKRDGGRQASLAAAHIGGPVWLLVGALVAGLAAFAALTTSVVDGGRLDGPDTDVARWVAHSMPGWAEWLARPPTWLGGFVGATLVVLATAIWLIRRRAIIWAATVVLVALGSQLLISATKEGYGRARPDAGSAIELPQSLSYPSGHALAGVAVFGLVGLIAGAHVRTRALRVTAVAAGFGLGIASGVSRVVLNVHYVTDVLAGWCYGLAWLAACLLAVRVLQR
jgi:membrane-associated phospholipid phosphatase